MPRRVKLTPAQRLGYKMNRLAREDGFPFKPNNSTGYGGMNLVPKVKPAPRGGPRRGR